jgi:hypothetical protein
VRRLVALFVVALLGASIYGLTSSSSGISVNHETVSGATLRNEISVITHNANLQCYITALDPENYALGAGGDSAKVVGVAAWTNLRVEGLAIDSYVTKTLHYVPSKQALVAAKSSLESEMTGQATSTSTTCPGTSSEAVAAMPAEMRTSEIEDQASSLYLVAKIKSTIPLTAASVQSFYTKHVALYDKLCISVAVVSPADESKFAAAQSAGATVAQLAKEFSEDSSGASGGAYGCYAPSSSSYTSIRAAVNGLKADTFATTPETISYGSTGAYLYIAVTKRTVTPLTQAADAVLADLKTQNAAAAATEKNDLLYVAAVHVDPAFGRWGLASSGPQVFVPALPKKSNVTGLTQVSASGSTYK